MKILVIAPHPDDEVLGCGGAIARHSQKGDDVCLCIVTQAYEPEWTREFIEKRPKEVENVCKILGIKKVFFLGFPTVKLDTIPQKEINDKVSALIKEISPDVLYIPHSGDINKDHKIVFESALVAARPLASSVKKIISYETLSETEWGSPFVPNLYVDISDTIKKKTEAMKSYESEVRDYPHPRSIEIIESHAKKRGSEAGLRFAEAFLIIREIT